MTIWYFHPYEKNTDKCEQENSQISSYFGKNFEITIFCPFQKLENIKNDGYTLQTICCQNSIVHNFMCDELVLSYESQLSLCAYAEKEALPDAIIFNGSNALPYFTILYSYLNMDKYKNCPIFLMPQDNLVQDVPPYLLPNWTIERLNTFCVENSHVITTKNCDELIADIERYKNNYTTPANFPFITKRKQTPILTEIAAAEKGNLTVVIPFYNAGKTLPETLASAFASNYPNIEVILINDGSTDEESLSVLKEEAEKYPQLTVISTQNYGLSAVRNLGCKMSKSEYITFLDSDDTVSSTYYSKCIAILNQYSNVGYVGSWLELFGDSAGIVPYLSSSLPEMLLYNSQASFCVSRRNVYESFGKNNVNMKNGLEDHDGWLSIAENGWFGVMIPEALCQYRLSSTSLSAQFSGDITHQKQMKLFSQLESQHTALYREYYTDVFNLMLCNGPGYLWNGTCNFTGIPQALMQKNALEKELVLAQNHSKNLENSTFYKIYKKLRNIK